MPTWIKRMIVFAGLTAAVVAVVRRVDFKGWMRSQVAVPHGRSGRIAALAMPMFHKLFYGPAAERLELGSDDVLLDVACGSGVFLDQYASHVARIAGIDLSGIQIELAQKRLHDRLESGSAEIVEGDAAALPWDDDVFTAAACLGSLEYFDDPAGTVAEIYRVLQPGGRAVVTYGVDDNAHAIVKQTEQWGLPHPTEAEARKLFEDGGFSLADISHLDGDYPARYVRAVKPE